MIRLPSAARTLAALVLVAATAACAHPVAPPPEADARLRAEIDAFRRELADAAARRDALRLRAAYTEDFTHTHTSGKVDGRDARIVALVAGEPTVETAPTPEFRLSCFAGSTCIARARSPIRRLSDGRWFDVRWTQTYVRTPEGWRIAVSQATGMPETVRDAP